MLPVSFDFPCQTWIRWWSCERCHGDLGNLTVFLEPLWINFLNFLLASDHRWHLSENKVFPPEVPKNAWKVMFTQCKGHESEVNLHVWTAKCPFFICEITIFTWRIRGKSMIFDGGNMSNPFRHVYPIISQFLLMNCLLKFIDQAMYLPGK